MRRKSREKKLERALLAMLGAWRFYYTIVRSFGGEPTPRMKRALKLAKEALR